MAAKSFLHQLGWKKGKYEVNKADLCIDPLGAIGGMEGRYRKQGGDEPPPKKARVDPDFSDDDELWGDSIEITQADLDDIELQASQAMSQIQHDTSVRQPTRTAPVPTAPRATATSQHYTSTGSTAGQPQQALRVSSGQFLKPQLSRTSSSSISSHSGSRGSGHYPTNNSSSHSNASSSHNSSSHSSYPGSISGYSSNNSSVSIKSGSSEERLTTGRGQTGSLSRGFSSESLDMTGLMGSNQSVMSEITRYKQELAAMKQQMEKLQEECIVKDGQNELLRDNLKHTSSELDTLKAERYAHIQEQHAQQSEREKTLKVELSKLQTQLQFNDQEKRELEAQIRNLQAMPSTSQSLSPRPRRVPVEEHSPKHQKTVSHDVAVASQTGFPSRKSFMSVEGSPTKQSPRKPGENVKVIRSIKLTPSGDNQALTSKCARHRQARRLQGLQLSPPTSDRLSDLQRLGRMVNVDQSHTDRPSDRNLIRLLNTAAVSSSVYNVQLDRDQETSMLSPQRLQQLRNLIDVSYKPEMLRLVTPDHYNMAISVLKRLVSAENQSTGSFNTAEAETGSNGSGKHRIDSQHHMIGAVFISLLPLINDYLKHYIDMLDAATQVDTSDSSLATNTSSSSPDSFYTSSESPSGSLGLLIKTTAEFANDVEGYCITCLEVLHELAACPSVRTVLLQDPAETTQPHEECMDTDQPGSRGKRFFHIPHKYISRLNLLHKIFKLSNPAYKGPQFNVKVVSCSLRILTTLATHADTPQMSSLQGVLHEESMQACIRQDNHPSLILHSLALFKSLVKSNLVVSGLCSNSTGCVLLCIYDLFVSDRWHSLTETVKIAVAKLAVEGLLYLASCHKGSFTLLLESDCQCSVQMVKSLIHLLHSVMIIYQHHVKGHRHKPHHPHLNGHSDKTPDRPSTSSAQIVDLDWFQDHSLVVTESDIEATSLGILQSGLQLLHLILQHDSAFSSRHLSAQHKYVQLVCGLIHIIRPLENNDSEINALHDLWDFNQDDSELSQDSDSEEETSMDQT